MGGVAGREHAAAAGARVLYGDERTDEVALIVERRAIAAAVLNGKYGTQRPFAQRAGPLRGSAGVGPAADDRGIGGPAAVVLGLARARGERSASDRGVGGLVSRRRAGGLRCAGLTVNRSIRSPIAPSFDATGGAAVAASRATTVAAAAASSAAAASDCARCARRSRAAVLLARRRTTGVTETDGQADQSETYPAPHSGSIEQSVTSCPIASARKPASDRLHAAAGKKPDRKKPMSRAGSTGTTSWAEERSGGTLRGKAQ